MKSLFNHSKQISFTKKLISKIAFIFIFLAAVIVSCQSTFNKTKKKGPPGHQKLVNGIVVYGTVDSIPQNQYKTNPLGLEYIESTVTFIPHRYPCSDSTRQNDAMLGHIQTFEIIESGAHTGRYNGTVLGGAGCFTAAVTYYDSKTRAKLKKLRETANIHNSQNQERMNQYLKLVGSFHILAGPKKLGKDFVSHFHSNNEKLDSVRIDFVVHDSTKE